MLMYDDLISFLDKFEESGMSLPALCEKLTEKGVLDRFMGFYELVDEYVLSCNDENEDEFDEFDEFDDDE